MDEKHGLPKYRKIALATGLTPVYLYVALLIQNILNPGSDAHLAPAIYAVGFMIFVVPFFMGIWYLFADPMLDVSKTQATVKEHVVVLFFINYGLLFAGCTVGVS